MTNSLFTLVSYRMSRRGLRAALVLLIFGHFIHPSMAAVSEQHPLSIEDALRVRSFEGYSPIEFSPNGRWLAYAVHDNQRVHSTGENDEKLYAATGVMKRVQGSDVWVSDTESGKERNLTGGRGDNWRPNWSPDGRYLAFLANRDDSGQTRLWLWDTLEDRIRPVSDTNIRATGENDFRWMPDSKSVLITTLPQGISVQDYVRKVLAPVESEEPISAKASAATAVVYRAPAVPQGGNEIRADLFNLNVNFLQDLERIDVVTGKSVPLVRGQRVEWFALSSDGTRLAYARPTRFAAPASPLLVFDLMVVTLSTLQEQVAVSGVLMDGAATWSPVEPVLAYRACPESGCDYFTVDMSGHGPRKISRLPPRPYEGSIAAPFWDSRGENLYFVFDGALWSSSIATGTAVELACIPHRRIMYRITQSSGILWSPDDGRSTVVLTYDDESKQDGFYKVDLRTGAATKLIESSRCFKCSGLGSDIDSYLTVVSRDGKRVAYYAEDAGHAPDLWIADDLFRDERRLTHLNPQFDKYKMGSARLVSWLSDDGYPLKGAVLLPPEYREGTRYPLVVWVYRNDSLSDKVNQFGFGEYPGPLNMQLFATRGYAVLFPDAKEEKGFPVAGLEKTVLPGVNKLIELGIADPDRLAVMGHSGGGYSTLALVVQTRRFKAAIDLSGFGNFLGSYGVMLEDGTMEGYREGEKILGGNPWQMRDRYLENSPVLYFDRVDTPLLIVHGSNDISSAAPFFADEAFADLRRLGKEVELVKYVGEGHAPQDWSYVNQVDLTERMIGWFNRYLSSNHE